jgi:GTP-binding protein EngB required for normal cell division
MDINTILELLPTWLTALLALASECLVVKYAIKSLKESKDSREIKELIKQNRQLLNSLREEKALTKELLTKIDKIKRGDNDQEVQKTL